MIGHIKSKTLEFVFIFVDIRIGNTNGQTGRTVDKDKPPPQTEDNFRFEKLERFLALNLLVKIHTLEVCQLSGDSHNSKSISELYSCNMVFLFFWFFRI